MQDLKHIFGYLGPYRMDIALGSFFVLVETVFELVIPVLMADIIDVGVANGDMDYILHQGVYMGLCALLSLATGLLYARFAARASYGLGARLRQGQYEKLQQFAFSNLDRFETSSLVTRLTTDVTVVQNAINAGLRPLVRSPVMLVMGDERPALPDLLCVRASAGGDPCVGAAEDCPHVQPPTAGHGPAQQRGAGGSQRHPGSEGLCPGGI